MASNDKHLWISILVFSKKQKGSLLIIKMSIPGGHPIHCTTRFILKGSITLVGTGEPCFHSVIYQQIVKAKNNKYTAT